MNYFPRIFKPLMPVIATAFGFAPKVFPESAEFQLKRQHLKIIAGSILAFLGVCLCLSRKGVFSMKDY